MSISRVKVGQPLDGPGLRAPGGFKWSENTRSKKNSPSRLNLSRAASGKRAAEPAELPALAVPDIADAPLSFLPFRQFLVLLGLGVVVIFLVLAMVKSNHRAVAYSYEISGLTEEKVRLVELNRQLNAQLAEVGSLALLEKVARENLGMTIPKEGQIVVIE